MIIWRIDRPYGDVIFARLLDTEDKERYAVLYRDAETYMTEDGHPVDESRILGWTSPETHSRDRVLDHASDEYEQSVLKKEENNWRDDVDPIYIDGYVTALVSYLGEAFRTGAAWQKEKDEATLREFFEKRNSGDVSYKDLLIYKEEFRDGRLARMPEKPTDENTIRNQNQKKHMSNVSGLFIDDDGYPGTYCPACGHRIEIDESDDFCGRCPDGTDEFELSCPECGCHFSANENYI